MPLFTNLHAHEAPSVEVFGVTAHTAYSDPPFLPGIASNEGCQAWLVTDTLK